jgi:hypothetical protein
MPDVFAHDPEPVGCSNGLDSCSDIPEPLPVGDLSDSSPQRSFSHFEKVRHLRCDVADGHRVRSVAVPAFVDGSRID